MSAVRSSRWDDACIAAAVLAVDPTGVAGISLRSAAGPVRDRWLACCRRLFPRQSRWHRIPLNVGDDRLLGGLDLSATLQAGRPVAEQGILAQADGGVITLSMAERLSPGTAAKIGCVLDRHEVLLERDGFARRARARFAVIALDEGIEPDERPPDSLLERLGLHLDLNGLPVSVTVDSGGSGESGDSGDCRYDIPRARKLLAHVQVAEEVFVALCEVSSAFGVSSSRAAWFALRVARAISALDNRIDVSEDDIALAARLVFAPRAMTAPADATRPGESPTDSAQDDTQDQGNGSQAKSNSQSSVASQSEWQQADARTSAADASASDARQPPQLSQPSPADQGGSTAAGHLQSREGQHSSTDQPTQDQQAAQQRASSQRQRGSLGERVLAAAKASLPANFLGQLQPAAARSGGSHHAGRTGAEHISQSRGRPTGSRAGELRPGARVNVIETLRAAAPWQRIRRLAAERAAESGADRAAAHAAAGRPKPTAPVVSGLAADPPGVAAPERTGLPTCRGAPDCAAARATSRAPKRTAPLIRVIKDDIRVIRFIRRNRSTTIFLVDASGSAAFNRLAEVKGAVELMLAESYVRRDRVALISFRGSAAQILLPPTNSLVRAKRELASLPGGGGTPLAIGIDTARVLADSLKRRGESPIVVVLTDGRPNITRDGKGNRVRAEADAVSAARMMRTNSITSLMVDTAPQPRVSTAQFAREMGARYIPLPYADAGALATVVSQCGRDAHDRHVHV